MQHRGRIIFALGAATLVVGLWVVSSRIATVSLKMWFPTTTRLARISTGT